GKPSHASGPTTPTTAQAATAPDAARAFAAALSAGNAQQAAQLTDAPDTAKAFLDSLHSSLPGKLTASVAKPADSAADLTMGWDFPGSGKWTYPTTIQLAQSGQSWRVHWAPAVIHPSLADGQSLALRVDAPGSLVDRDGKPL